MKKVAIYFTLLCLFSLQSLVAQNNLAGNQIHYNGWGALQIGKDREEFREDIIATFDTSRLSAVLYAVFQNDSGYRLDRLIPEMVYAANPDNYSTCLGETVTQAQLDLDSGRIVSITLYFDTSQADILAKKISEKFSRAQIMPLNGKRNCYSEILYSGENKMMFFSQGKINGTPLPVCFIRWWKYSRKSPESEAESVRSLIISKTMKPPGIDGVNEIVLGVSREKIQQYLLPGKFESHIDRQYEKVEGRGYSNGLDKMYFRVNTALSKYKSYSGIPIKLIELKFTENDILDKIIIVFDNTPENQNKLLTALKTQWWDTQIRYLVDPATLRSSDYFEGTWTYPAGNVSVSNYLFPNYPSPDNEIYLIFNRDIF
ncbi:MAG: hypothetical protein MUC87_12500 [Bacteroidia bacterium]|jgi:hypothetical protein|nr:hypothetical protein [Bacteroidia bacterium]